MSLEYKVPVGPNITIYPNTGYYYNDSIIIRRDITGVVGGTIYCYTEPVTITGIIDEEITGFYFYHNEDNSSRIEFDYHGTNYIYEFPDGVTINLLGNNGATFENKANADEDI